VALGLSVGLVLAWLIGIPFLGLSDTYQLVINTTTTIITFIMVFVVQATQNRDSKAIHAKLDGLVEATDDADEQLENIENMTEREIDALHQEVTGGEAETGR
jgi:low affinity Fe/Cu permease